MEKGFSLIEFLLYIAILSVAILGINLVATNIFRTTARTNAIQEVVYNGRFVMDKLDQQIRNSTEIIQPENSEGEILEVSGPDETTVFEIHEQEEDVDRLMMARNGMESEITTSKVNVESVNFKKISDNAVRVSLDLTHKNPEELAEQEARNIFVSSFTLNQ